jgi:hypothetical protein
MTSEPSTLTEAVHVAERPIDRFVRISWFDYGPLNGRNRRNPVGRAGSGEGRLTTPSGPSINVFAAARMVSQARRRQVVDQ